MCVLKNKNISEICELSPIFDENSMIFWLYSRKRFVM